MRMLFWAGFILWLPGSMYAQDTLKTIRPHSTLPLMSEDNKKKIDIGELKISLNDKGDKWIKFAFSNQVWLRRIENNPGTVVNNTPQDFTYDAGIRRMRLTVTSQISSFYTIFVQFGMNNQSFASGGGSGTGANGAGKKAQVFFHDAYNELAVLPSKNIHTGHLRKGSLYIGAGLHSWNGVSRLTNASSTRMLAADLPVYNFPTIEISDQMSRQFGLFFRGEYDKINYRFSMNKPFMTSTIPLPGGSAVDNNNGGKPSLAGYVFYQFLEKEISSNPFLIGNYLGAKKVLNFGLGFFQNSDGTQSLTEDGIIHKHDITVLGADIFGELPIGPKDKGMSLNFYTVFYQYDLGPDYLRTTALLNSGVADETFTGQTALEGFGNARMSMGTGNIWHTQAGLKMPKFSDIVTLQPYVIYACKNMEALNEPGHFFDAGLNAFLFSQNTRLVLNYSNRPLYHPETRKIFTRRSEYLLSLQFIL